MENPGSEFFEPPFLAQAANDIPMNPMHHRSILDQPSGTEGLQLRETWNHRNTVLELSNTLESWGYLPVRTPVIDYYDAYAPLLGDDHVNTMYRLIDRDGDLLAVRSDATLFLAKQVARMLHSEQLPVRVYYAETILRPDDRENISRNEFFQIGGELIGRSGRDGDLEAATLLLRMLDTVVPGKAVLHVGSRKLIDVLTSSLCDTGADEFRHALELHDESGCRSLLAGTVSEALTAPLLHFLMQIGTSAEIQQELVALQKRVERLPEGFFDQARALIDTAIELESLFEGTGGSGVERIRIDPSESGSQRYHSGIAFRAYAEGAEAAVASGGRYDTLYGHFGLETEAVGFSIMLRRMEQLRSPADLPDIRSVPRDGRSFAERLREADNARARGENINLE